MAKRSKSPIPKKVAGMKVPGVLRHADWVNTALNSPLIREAIAAALVAGAGAAAAVLSRGGPAAEGVKKAGAAVADTAGDAASAAAGFTHAAADAVTGLAAEAAKKLLPVSDAADGQTRFDAKPRGRKPKGENPQPTSADA